MAFPVSPILDDFTGVDGTTPPSANWTNTIDSDGDTGGLKIASNELAGTGSANNSGWWNASTFGPDCEARIRINNKGSDGAWFYLFIRLQNPGTTAPDGYALRVDTVAGTDTLRLYRMDDGAFTQIGSTDSREIAVNDEVGIEAIGSAIKAYHKTAAGAWANVISTTDATYAAAGFAGVTMRGGTGDLDDFGAATIAAAAVSAPPSPAGRRFQHMMVR